jgi:hypothetical protein
LHVNVNRVRIMRLPGMPPRFTLRIGPPLIRPMLLEGDGRGAQLAAIPSSTHIWFMLFTIVHAAGSI